MQLVLRRAQKPTSCGSCLRVVRPERARAGMGAQISQDYAGRDLFLVAVLKGSVVFSRRSDPCDHRSASD